MGDQLPPVELGAPAVALAAGSAHNCALLADGRVKCWGFNSYGQLGVGDRKDRGRQPADMGNALPAVDLGDGFSVQSIHAGGWNSCALSTAGEVKCWGLNQHGLAGQGDEALDWGIRPGELATMPPVGLGDCE